MTMALTINVKTDDTETIARLLVARLGFDYDDLDCWEQCCWIVAALYYMRREFDDE